MFISLLKRITLWFKICLRKSTAVLTRKNWRLRIYSSVQSISIRSSHNCGIKVSSHSSRNCLGKLIAVSCL